MHLITRNGIYQRVIRVTALIIGYSSNRVVWSGGVSFLGRWNAAYQGGLAAKRSCVWQLYHSLQSLLQNPPIKELSLSSDWAPGLSPSALTCVPTHNCVCWCNRATQPFQLLARALIRAAMLRSQVCRWIRVWAFLAKRSSRMTGLRFVIMLNIFSRTVFVGFVVVFRDVVQSRNRTLLTSTRIG